VFGNKFAEGLSLIDLVFCEGPAARTVVATSARLPWTNYERAAFKIL